MSYTVFARKYRPQTFADLVGQEHVTRTLENAIKSGRVAHAFLFTGVRGVGKTTSARILAKALNCEQGPTPSPCNACDPCTQITSGVDLDVLEMDGASNNSVDDVRRLQESIPYRPARDRFKVVIVDEVHMLSTGAFNAFLKTLEEPPPHVKFIFATTESHKVPVTIRSRCQRYDFRLIPQHIIAERVRQILAAESIQADDQAVTLVAREAAGSMRDALTLLDQVVAFSGGRLVGNEVAAQLGIADREHLYALAEAVLTGDGKRALEVIDAVATQGLDLLHFAKQWLELARDMVVLRVAGDQPRLVDLPAEERARALACAQKAEVLELERAFAGIAQLVDEVGRSSAPRTVLEMGAVRLATRPPLRDLAQLIARLEALERGGGAPTPAPRGPGRPAPDAAPRGGSSAASASGPMEPARPSPATPRTPPAGEAKPNPFARFIPNDALGGSSAQDAPGGPGPGRSEPATSSVTPLHRAAPTSAPKAVAPAVPLEGPPNRPAAQLASAPKAVAPTPPVESPPNRAAAQLANAAVALPAAAPPPASTPGIDQARWVDIVQHLRTHDPRWAAMYEHGVPSELSASSVVVLFPEGSFFGRQAQSPDGTEALRRAAHAVFNAQPSVAVQFAAEVRGLTLAQLEAAQVDERKEALKRKALSHPRVIEALKVFPELGQKHEVQVD